MTPTLMKKHIEENTVLSKDNLAFGYTYINETPVVICINIEDCTEKIVFGVREHKELLWITTTLKNKDHKKAVRLAEENAEYLIKELDKWVLDEDSADMNVEEIMKVMDESLLVSDSIAFISKDKGYLTALHIDKRFCKAEIDLATKKVIEHSMTESILERTKAALERNYSLLVNEIKERE